MGAVRRPGSAAMQPLFIVMPPAAPPPPPPPAPPAAAPVPPAAPRPLWEHLETFRLAHVVRRKKRTQEEYTKALAAFLRFLAGKPADVALGSRPDTSLADDTPRQFLRWLTVTPISFGKRKLPESFSEEAIRCYLSFLWQRETGAQRRENTNHRLWRHIDPFFQFLNARLGNRLLPVPPEELPRYDAPTPIVPGKEEIADWMRDELSSATPPEAWTKKHRFAPTRLQRMHVVQIQAVIYLTGMRCEEAFVALYEDLEDNWLLVRPGKTNRPRVIYVPDQAVAIIRSMHAAGAKLLLNWPYSYCTYHKYVQGCTSRERFQPHEDRQQGLRQKLATYLRRRNRDAEVYQLGHGKTDVVQQSYADCLRPLPKLMEKRRLPELGVPWFQWPEATKGSRVLPRRLLKLRDEIRDQLRRDRRLQAGE